MLWTFKRRASRQKRLLSLCDHRMIVKLFEFGKWLYGKRQLLQFPDLNFFSRPNNASSTSIRLSEL